MVKPVCYEMSWMPLPCGKEYGMQPCKIYLNCLLVLTVEADEMLEVPGTFLLSVWDATEERRAVLAFFISWKRVFPAVV